MTQSTMKKIFLLILILIFTISQGEFKKKKRKYSAMSIIIDQSTENPSTSKNDEVFMCEGLKCPKEATTCKILEASNEPINDKIILSKYCMDENKNILKQEQKVSKNENPGSSFNSIKTLSRDQEKFDKLSEDLNETMKQKMQSMDEIFSNGFFANNPFMPPMPSINFMSGNNNFDKQNDGMRRAIFRHKKPKRYDFGLG